MKFSIKDFFSFCAVINIQIFSKYYERKNIISKNTLLFCDKTLTMEIHLFVSPN